jgi:hypothetical protein
VTVAIDIARRDVGIRRGKRAFVRREDGINKVQRGDSTIETISAGIGYSTQR